MEEKIIKKIKRNIFLIGAILAVIAMAIWRDINILLGIVIGLLVTNFNFHLMVQQLYTKPMKGQNSFIWLGFLTRYILYFVVLCLVYLRISKEAAFACIVSFFTLRFAIYLAVGKGGDLDGSTL